MSLKQTIGTSSRTKRLAVNTNYHQHLYFAVVIRVIGRDEEPELLPVRFESIGLQVIFNSSIYLHLMKHETGTAGGMLIRLLIYSSADAAALELQNTLKPLHEMSCF